MNMSADSVDYKAIAQLVLDGRTTWAELGHLLGLSAPAAAERVRKLEERGLIRGYTALVDAAALGYPLLAYIFVTLENPRRRSAFLRSVATLDEVLECHHIAGEDDYLLKVRCRGTEDLDRVLSQELKDKCGVSRTRTIIVLATSKQTRGMPIAETRPTGRRTRRGKVRSRDDHDAE